jgi:hypothetical protein
MGRNVIDGGCLQLHLLLVLVLVALVSLWCFGGGGVCSAGVQGTTGPMSRLCVIIVLRRDSAGIFSIPELTATSQTKAAALETPEGELRGGIDEGAADAGEHCVCC